MGDTQALRGLQASPSMWGETGYYNLWGGFHRTRDRVAYWRLLRIALRHFWLWSHIRFAAHMAWRRWVHRACDTTDFHHDIGCLRDPFVRRMEAQRGDLNG